MNRIAIACLLLTSCQLLESPEKQALAQTIQQYELVKKSGSPMERCTYASLVVAAAVQATDEQAHGKWKQVEADECKAAGVPH